MRLAHSGLSSAADPQGGGQAGRRARARRAPPWLLRGGLTLADVRGSHHRVYIASDDVSGMDRLCACSDRAGRRRGGEDSPPYPGMRHACREKPRLCHVIGSVAEIGERDPEGAGWFRARHRRGDIHDSRTILGQPGGGICMARCFELRRAHSGRARSRWGGWRRRRMPCRPDAVLGRLRFAERDPGPLRRMRTGLRHGRNLCGRRLRLRPWFDRLRRVVRESGR
jgi:hypothetical protein